MAANLFKTEDQMAFGRVDPFDSDNQLVPKPESIPLLMSFQRMRVAIESITIIRQRLDGNQSIDRNLDRSDSDSGWTNPRNDSIL